MMTPGITALGATVERNRYADLLRVCAVGAVVLGHWLVTDVTYQGGQLSGLDALYYVSWGRWLTLFFQVMPVFFLVGGYVNAVSWTAHHARGEHWSVWIRGRALRLLWPATVYVAAAVLAVTAAGIGGVSASELAEVGWFVALHLWFLPVYLLLIALTPVMLAAHRRWGLAVPAVMAAGAAGVDIAVTGPRLPLIGFANYLLVWGSIHQCGFAWRDGGLNRPRWLPWVLAAAGAVILAGLLAWGPFPVDMIAAVNASPPSVALLALAAAQTGLLVAAEPAGSRLLATARRWRVVTRLNATAMTVYLWHMAPVVLLAAAAYPLRVIPQPDIGSLRWWELRPAWIAILAVILVPLTATVMRLERPLRRLPPGRAAAPGLWPALLLGCGIAATVLALARLAIGGFAPGGHPPVAILAIYAGGIAVTLLSGYLTPRSAAKVPPGQGSRPAAHDDAA